MSKKQIIEDYQKGVKIVEIAKIHGVSTATIYKLVKKNRKDKAETLKQKIIKLGLQGYTYKDIGYQLGCTRQYAGKIFKDNAEQNQTVKSLRKVIKNLQNEIKNKLGVLDE
jgi:DNA-binding CsgD family transcriptional regulator